MKSEIEIYNLSLYESFHEVEPIFEVIIFWFKKSSSLIDFQIDLQRDNYGIFWYTISVEFFDTKNLWIAIVWNVYFLSLRIYDLRFLKYV